MSFRCDGTLDIECAQWTRFGVATTHDSEGTRVHRSIEALVDYLLTRQGCYWAHCGGRYDFLPIAEEFRRRQVKCQMDPAGSRIARVVAGKLSLRDSYLLIPLKHAVACSMVGMVKPAMGLPCICGQGCDGTCAVQPNETRASVIARCAFDSESLYTIIGKLQSEMESRNIHLRGTVGTTAWFNAQLRLDLPNAKFPPPVWRAIHRAYYGGRLQVFRPRARGPGSHWDMSAAYPSALARAELPVGNWSEVGARDAAKALSGSQAGIYECSVRVPDCFLPPLPVRGDDDRLSYPVGEFTGSWVLPELEQAIERGVEVVKVRSAIVWERTERVFETLMREWVSLRAQMGKRTAMGQWLRLLANSLTGKLAEGPDRKSISFFPDSKKIRTCTGRRPCSLLKCVGACMAWEQIDMDGAIWGIPYLRYAKSSHIHWAAYLTASTRSAWLAAAEIDPENLVYGATDSIWTLSRQAPGVIGANLDEWEYKCGWSEFESIGPGAYRYRDDRGRAWVKTSGISLSDEEWLNGGVARFDVAPLVSAAKRGGSLFKRIPRTWSLNRKKASQGIFGDRVLDGTSGLTYPMCYGH